MQRSDFSKASPGKPCRISKGVYSFSPTPIPEIIDIDWKTTRSIIRFEKSAQALSTLVDILPLPSLTSLRFLLYKEAHSVAIFSGKTISLPDFMVYCYTDRLPSSLHPFTRGIFFCKKTIDNRLLSDIGFLEDLVMHIVPSMAGRGIKSYYRTSRSDLSIDKSLLFEPADYTPPPSALLKSGLYSFGKSLRQGSLDLPPVVYSLLAFFQLMALSPFRNQNGIILSFFLAAITGSSGAVALPLFTLPKFFHAEKEAINEVFMQVVGGGDYFPFINLFTQKLADNADYIYSFLMEFDRLKNSYINLHSAKRHSEVALGLIDMIFSQPVFSVQNVADHLKITFRSAQLNIDKLAEFRFLMEITGSKRNRVYVAPEILELADQRL